MVQSILLQTYLAAIAAGDDDAAEQTVAALTADDAQTLAVLATEGTLDEQWWALRALAEVGAAEAVPVLCAALSSPDAGVRAVAALALSHVHGRAAPAVAAVLDQVTALLADDSGLVRQAAADSLAICGNDAVPALGRVLRSSTHQGARTRAASALRKIATMPAAAILYPLLNDENHMVRMYAYEGLDEMGLLENVLLVP